MRPEKPVFPFAREEHPDHANLARHVRAKVRPDHVALATAALPFRREIPLFRHGGRHPQVARGLGIFSIRIIWV
jgi:hypothetical protein